MASKGSKSLDILSGLTPRQREGVLRSIVHPSAPRRREAGRKARGGRRVVCPYCGSVDCSVRTGCLKGRQRYRCKVTGRYFTSTTGKVTHRSHKPISVWRKFIECIVGGLTLAQGAEACAISVHTAFCWKHKILDALCAKRSKLRISGDVEVRETYLNLSYSGNHTRSRSGFKMPRPPHKFGVKGETAGEERVCVLCAQGRGRDGRRLSVSRFACLGLATRMAVDAALKNCGASRSALPSELGGDLVGENGGAWERAAPEGRRGVPAADDCLEAMREFLKPFQGVSSKHLDKYLACFDFLRAAGDDGAKTGRSLFHCIVNVRCYTRRDDISLRPPCPVPLAAG